MSFDDDATDDSAGFRPPPHPDDRLWRHPSELGSSPRTAQALPRSVAADQHHRWGTAVVGVAGLLLVAAGVTVMVVGLRERANDSESYEQVAASPGTATPRALGLAPAQRSPEAHNPEVVWELATTVVRVEAGGQRGSGVVIGEDGIVLTSYSVVGEADSVAVALADGRLLTGNTLGIDPLTGLAVVDLPGRDYATAPLADPADGVAAGAMATSLGVDETGHLVIDTGQLASRLSGIDRPDVGLLDGVLGFDATRAPLTKGGPVIDHGGELVGITTWTDDDRAYVTPIAVASKVADDLVAYGQARHPWLGIDGYNVVDGDQPAGVGVAAVVSDSPAAGALQPDDVIVAVDDQPVTNMSSLVVELRQHSPGDELALGYEREDPVVADERDPTDDVDTVDVTVTALPDR